MPEGICRWLLKLYPVRFRRKYGGAMLQFNDRVRAEHGGGRKLNPRAAGYRLTEEAARQLAKTRHGATRPVVLSIVFGLVIGLLGDAPRLALFGVYLPFSLLIPKLLWQTRRLERYWRGFELVLESERILILEHGTVAKILTRRDTKRVVEASWGLKVLAVDARKHFWVPSVLSGYDELRDYLSNWVRIERPSRPVPEHEPRQRPILALLNRHVGIVGCVSLYASAVLVRSSYVLYPLVAMVGFTLLQYAYFLGKSQRVPTLIKVIPLILVAILVVRVAFALS